jgi:hypothetical protein
MKSLIAVALLTAAAPAFAQGAAPEAPASAGKEQVNQLIVYGKDPCPQSTDEVITVCARRPESDRYRIPERLRGDPNDPGNQAWANKASELSYVGRGGIGSCSPVGPGGASGCFSEIVRQARAERRGSDQVNWDKLIEQARQERLSGIDSAAAQEQKEIDEAQPPQ